jgi:Tol biopolymer transport system component
MQRQGMMRRRMLGGLWMLAVLWSCGAVSERATPSPPAHPPTLLVGRDNDLWAMAGGQQPLEQRTYLAPSAAAFDPVMSPDGQQLAYTYQPPLPTPKPNQAFVLPQTTIHLANVSAMQGAAVLPSLPDYDSMDQPAWSPDGATLYAHYSTLRFDAQGSVLASGESIISIDLTTHTTTTLMLNAIDPAASPDGRSVAAIRLPRDSGSQQLIRYDLQQGTEEVLLNDPTVGGLEGPIWSADGSAVYLAAIPAPAGAVPAAPWRWLLADTASAHGAGWQVWRIDVTTKQVTRLSPQLFDTPSLVLEGSTVKVWELNGLWQLDGHAANQTPTMVMNQGGTGGITFVP